MDSPRFKSSPARILWLILIFIYASLFEIIYLEVYWDAFGFDKSNWLFIAAGFSALSGWIVAAIIALRNSTKQHTINTLLQSRLSTAFNEKAKELTKHFPGKTAVTEADLTDPTKLEGIQAIKYLLNYHEFIAIGISQRDLDESLLKESIQGIVAGLYDRSRVYIEDRRRDDLGNFSYFLWLYTRWKPKTRSVGLRSPEPVISTLDMPVEIADPPAEDQPASEKHR